MYLSFIILEPYQINSVPSEGHYTTMLSQSITVNFGSIYGGPDPRILSSICQIQIIQKYFIIIIFNL